MTMLVLLALAVRFLNQHNEVEMRGAVKVIDGDSLVLKGQRLRLLGIDAPELNQTCSRDHKSVACGKKAREYLRTLIGDQNIVCNSQQRDKYDRRLARCFAGDTDLNAKMVSNGWAVAYGRYSSEQSDAKMHTRGLWQMQFENPQEWRKLQKQEYDPLHQASWLQTVKRWFGF